MKPTLLILAAGMGSRYGGLKQIDPMGPSGETILDYSVFDAARAGFGKVVFVIRPDFEHDFRERVMSRFAGRIATDCVFQTLDKAIGEAGKVGLNSLVANNRMVNMVKCGSKGADLNIAQMIALLGQQSIEGKRITYGFQDRTLPHFKRYDDGAEAARRRRRASDGLNAAGDAGGNAGPSSSDGGKRRPTSSSLGRKLRSAIDHLLNTKQ
jgi:hypothetical protein